MKLAEIQHVLRDVECSGYTFEARASLATGSWYLVGTYVEADTVTGIMDRQFTRRWLLSPRMSKSEIVSTAFACVNLSMEHRTREWFTYKGHAIYMPHYDVDDLVAISDKRQVR